MKVGTLTLGFNAPMAPQAMQIALRSITKNVSHGHAPARMQRSRRKNGVVKNQSTYLIQKSGYDMPPWDCSALYGPPGQLWPAHSTYAIPMLARMHRYATVAMPVTDRDT